MNRFTSAGTLRMVTKATLKAPDLTVMIGILFESIIVTKSEI